MPSQISLRPADVPAALAAAAAKAIMMAEMSCSSTVGEVWAKPPSPPDDGSHQDSTKYSGDSDTNGLGLVVSLAAGGLCVLGAAAVAMAWLFIFHECAEVCFPQLMRGFHSASARAAAAATAARDAGSAVGRSVAARSGRGGRGGHENRGRGSSSPPPATPTHPSTTTPAAPAAAAAAAAPPPTQTQLQTAYRHHPNLRLHTRIEPEDPQDHQGLRQPPPTYEDAQDGSGKDAGRIGDGERGAIRLQAVSARRLDGHARHAEHAGYLWGADESGSDDGRRPTYSEAVGAGVGHTGYAGRTDPAG